MIEIGDTRCISKIQRVLLHEERHPAPVACLRRGRAAPELRARGRGTEPVAARRLDADQGAGGRGRPAAVRPHQPQGLADHGRRVPAGLYAQGARGDARRRGRRGPLPRTQDGRARRRHGQHGEVLRAATAGPVPRRAPGHRGAAARLQQPRRARRAACSRATVELAIMGRPPQGWPTRAEPFAMHPHVLVTAPDHPFTRMERVPARALQEEVVHRARTGLRHARRARRVPARAPPARRASRCRCRATRRSSRP